MSNFMLKFRFGLKSRFGLIPGTSRIESRDTRFREEYQEFLDYEKSGEPQRFRELEETVTSQDFEDRKKQISRQRLSDTEAGRKFADYKLMKDSPEFKGYFRFVTSRELDDFLKLDNSAEIKEFEELGEYLKSAKFKAIKKSKFKNSEAWQKYLDYNKLKKTPEIKDYFKIKHSRHYKALKELEGSKTLNHLEELYQMVNSSEFMIMKRTMSDHDFKKTSEYAKFKEYQNLQSEPEIKSYHKLIENKAFTNYKLLENSQKLEEYNRLEKFVHSSDLNNAKKEFELKKATELHKLNDYNTLKKSVKIKSYYKLKNSKDIEYFRKLHGSAELEKFRELEKYVNSNEFKEIRDYMKSPDKFKKSPEYQQLLEYRKLKKSATLKWYLKLKGSDRFDEVGKWELAFSDDFNGNSLDKSKWLTSFYWGDQLLNKGYSLSTDLHFYKESGNCELDNGMLRLYTRKEEVSGQAWDPALGFIPRDFEYTSALINTGKSFRQKYGAFEAKVRMHPSQAVYHAFWMLADKSVPHIDIFRFSGQKRKSIGISNYWQSTGKRDDINRTHENIAGPDFSKGFFIYRLEWYPDRIVWKINNTVVRIEEEGVPDEPMYIIFSSGVEGDPSGNGLPTSLDIDWVRCYRYVEEEKSNKAHSANG